MIFPNNYIRHSLDQFVTIEARGLNRPRDWKVKFLTMLAYPSFLTFTNLIQIMLNYFIDYYTKLMYVCLIS